VESFAVITTDLLYSNHFFAS